jgi:tetratricopeptide (TPR) repeat protein
MQFGLAMHRLAVLCTATLFSVASLPLIAQAFESQASEHNSPPPPPLKPAVSEPKFIPTPEQVGDSQMAHRSYQAAIESYKKGPRNSAELWNKMGVAYQLMFNADEAAKCYQMSLKLNPRNAVAVNNLGTIYVSLKEYATAERTYKRALKLDPKSALIQKNLGTVLLAEHKYKKGWQAYQGALAIDPQIFENNSSVRVENPASVQDRGAMNYYMAKGCVKAGMNERAIEYLRMAMNEGFTNPKKIIADSEFAALRDDPAFQQMLAAQRIQ